LDVPIDGGVRGCVLGGGHLTRRSRNPTCRLPIVHAVVDSFDTRGRAYAVTHMYIPSEGADPTSNVDEMVQTLRFTA
jgi:hypothetical protein